jgi:PAS domain S-box-containing protein
MTEADVFELVHSTADAAFAITNDGIIRCWNSAAEKLFGVGASSALESMCSKTVCGRQDLNTPGCDSECGVLQRARQGQPTAAFDLQVKTSSGPRWANVSVMVAPVRAGKLLIVLARDVHYRKQIEEITRGFLRQFSAVSGIKIEELLASTAVPHLDLTVQETAVLRSLVEGKSTKAISEALHVSPATIRNHIEHILQKLHTHSRIEAVLLAIREKLV